MSDKLEMLESIVELADNNRLLEITTPPVQWAIDEIKRLRQAILDTVSLDEVLAEIEKAHENIDLVPACWYRKITREILSKYFT